MSEKVQDSDGGKRLSETIILKSERQESINTPALSELSVKDQSWRVHRSESDQIEKLYDGTEFQRYSDRIHFCSEFLNFVLKPTQTDALKLKLKSAR
ncbi:MAG: hypothetical protein AB4372_18060, partial [Xenococcus sp. (in: cyanobacteria)]